MTCHSCVTKCVKNCGCICFESSNHANKDCHLKKCFCCKNKDINREMSPEYKVCEDYNQIKKPVLHKEKFSNQNDHDICNTKSSSKKKSYDISSKYRSQDKHDICEICCCLVYNCKCKEKNFERNLRPRTLSEDLPLYDERSHLLGYIKRGSVIDMPFCAKSQDPILEEKSIVNVAYPQLSEGTNLGCMASCRYAEGIRKQYSDTTMSRWTTQTAFEHATRTNKPTAPSYEKQKPFLKCPCGK